MTIEIERLTNIDDIYSDAFVKGRIWFVTEIENGRYTILPDDYLDADYNGKVSVVEINSMFTERPDVKEFFTEMNQKFNALKLKILTEKHDKVEKAEYEHYLRLHEKFRDRQ